jgi:hypothetical protein
VDQTGIEWQKDSYDHVLRNAERGPQEFQNTARYIANNPVRAGIVEAAEDYPFAGVMLPGYATLRWHDERYWSVFWQHIHKRYDSALAEQIKSAPQA